MNSWLEYKAGFAKLVSATEQTFLELQFGDGTEDWFLEGGSESARQEFLALAKGAGKSLKAVHLVDHETGSAVSPETRWFRLLRERNNPNEMSPIVLDRVGVALSSWTLTNIAARSAELCVELERTSPIQKTPNWLVRTFREDRAGTIVKAIGALVLCILLVRLGSR